jgi:hypothetical protein
MILLDSVFSIVLICLGIIISHVLIESVTSHCWISIKHDTSLHCFCRHNTQHPHSTCSCVQALLVLLWWIYTYLYFVVNICMFKNRVIASADNKWTVILCVLLMEAMNYAEPLLNFGMSKSSFFIIDVNNLDVYVIITIAVCFDFLLTVHHGILMSQH